MLEIVDNVKDENTVLSFTFLYEMKINGYLNKKLDIILFETIVNRLYHDFNFNPFI